MTTPELADAVAAQRDAYRPDDLPPFAVLLVRKRRRDRRRRLLAVTASAAAAAVVAGAVTALPSWNQPGSVTGGVGAGERAPQPDEQRLRSALGALTPPVALAQVQQMTPGAAGIGDQPRKQLAGFTGETADRTTSVSWAVLSPALTDTEVIAVAGSVEGSKGLELGTPVGRSDHAGPVKAVAYRFDRGTMIRIWAWSSDGGVVTITSGNGATVTDVQVTAWQRAAQDLLTP